MSDEMHYMDCGLAGGWPHRASDHNKSTHVHRCDFCGEDFILTSERNLQEIYGPGDWQLVCIPCLDVTEVEYGK